MEEVGEVLVEVEVVGVVVVGEEEVMVVEVVVGEEEGEGGKESLDPWEICGTMLGSLCLVTPSHNKL